MSYYNQKGKLGVRRYRRVHYVEMGNAFRPLIERAAKIDISLASDIVSTLCKLFEDDSDKFNRERFERDTLGLK